MIHFVVPAAHERMMGEYLELWGKPVADRLRIVRAESLPRKACFERGTYVLAALDRLTPGLDRFVRELHERLEGAAGVRFLNHPTRTLRRFALLDELARRGRNRFRAVHATDDLGALRFPVFVRQEHAHDGAISPLLHSRRELDGAIGRAIVQGYRLRDLLVVEFCDTRDSAGYYRKYAAFIVGGTVIARSLNYGRGWMLKAQGTEFTRAMAEEEREYVLTNPHARALAEIAALASVEYGRIDYALQDGRIQTWEINLNPTIGRGLRPSTGRSPAELEPIRNETKEHFYRRFRGAWESVDPTNTALPAITVELPAETVRRALAGENDVPSGPPSGAPPSSAIRRALQPVKPLVAPLVSFALPLLGAAAVRRARRP